MVMNMEEYFQSYMKRQIVYNKTAGSVNTNYLRWAEKPLMITYNGFIMRKSDVFEEEIRRAQEAIFVILLQE